jgi:putative cardiolipin synthase
LVHCFGRIDAEEVDILQVSIRRVFSWAFGVIVGLIVACYLLLVAGLKLSAWDLKTGVQAGKETGPTSSVVRERKSTHSITLLDHGLSSFNARLSLIRSAKQSIELEFFIYDLDFSAKWITSELVARANEGIKVRLLVDFAGPIFQLRPEYAEFLRRNGVEVRYYNTSPIYRFVSIHHRNHRKLLVVDDVASIVGGRNIADDYFDLSPDYNFLDSDVLVRGAIVKDIRETFDLYWHSKYSSTPDYKAPRDFLELEPGEADRRTRIEEAGVAQLASEVEGPCSDVLYVTDFPGVAEANRRVYSTVKKLLSDASDEVVGESPYFVLTQEGADLVRSVTRRGVKMRVLTNSLDTTDAYYTVAALWLGLDRISRTGLTLLAYRNSASQATTSDKMPPTVASRKGIHAKRAVIDSVQYLIGTYNVDPRSANLNSEMVLVCRDGREIAQAARGNIIKRMQGAQPIASLEMTDRSALIGDASAANILSMLLITPVAGLFNFLL